MVVESAFPSVRELGQRLHPWLPVKLLATIRYDSAEKIGAIRAPVRVIDSPDDENVPFALGCALYERAAERKAILATEAGHNDGGFLRRPEWRRAVGEFVRAAFER